MYQIGTAIVEHLSADPFISRKIYASSYGYAWATLEVDVFGDAPECATEVLVDGAPHAFARPAES